MKRYYNIADLSVEMTATGRTAEQAEPYICNATGIPDIVISPETLIEEGYNLVERWPERNDDFRTYMGTGMLFYRKLLNFDGMMLHSSCVVVDGRAYLFTANSGTGKSTHTTKYLELFGDRAYILNDDKPAIRYVDGTWYAYGTPWSGKHDISVNEKVPIAGIAVIERAETNSISAYTGIDAITSILMQVNRPKNVEYRVKLLDLLDKLISEVPVWKLKCNMDPEAAIVSYEAMSGKKYEKGE